MTEKKPFQSRPLPAGKPTLTAYPPHKRAVPVQTDSVNTDDARLSPGTVGSTMSPLTSDQATAKVEHFFGKKPNPSAPDFVAKERPAEVDALKQKWMEEGARKALEEAKSRIDTVRSEEIIGWMLYTRDYGFPVPPGPSAHSGFPVPKPAFLTKCGA